MAYPADIETGAPPVRREDEGLTCMKICKCIVGCPCGHRHVKLGWTIAGILFVCYIIYLLFFFEEDEIKYN